MQDHTISYWQSYGGEQYVSQIHVISNLQAALFCYRNEVKRRKVTGMSLQFSDLNLTANIPQTDPLLGFVLL